MIEVVDPKTSTLKDVRICLSKGKSVESEVKDFVLLISKDQLIEQNMVGNFEFRSQLLKDVDMENYNKIGWKKVLEDVRADATKV